MVQYRTGAVQPADRKKNKPIYLVIAEDPSEKSKIQFYRAQALIEAGSLIDFIGHRLTKAQKDKFVLGPYEDPDPSWEEVNAKIPIARVIRIENVKYKKTIDKET